LRKKRLDALSQLPVVVTLLRNAHRLFNGAFAGRVPAATSRLVFHGQFAAGLWGRLDGFG
jgi:hypothetical protein